jgi:hypothetical protein
MADAIDKFKQRLIEMEAASGLSQSKFAESIGLKLTTYRNIVGQDSRGRGGKGPYLASIYEMISALGVDIVWSLLVGEKPPVRIAESPDIVFNSFEEEGFIRPRSDLTDRYAAIPLLKDAAAAGSPAEIDETQTEPNPVIIYKDRSWLPHGLENYTCVHVRGRSMFPILDDGDIVAIDHAERDPKRLDGKLTAFNVNGGITIKWCKYFEDRGQVIGIPENKEEFDHAVSLLGEEIDDGIVGMVRWWWSKR